MSGLTDTREQACLDNEFGSGSPATLYLAAFTTMPADDGTGGVEPTGGGYARIPITNNATNFPAAVAGNPSTKSLAVQFAHAVASISWSPSFVKGVGWFDALTSGNLRWFQELIDTPSVISSVNTGTDLITTAAVHGLVAGDRVVFRDADGNVPAGLDQTTIFWVIATGLTTTDFKVSLTQGGAAVDITAVGQTTTKVYKTYQQDVLAGNTLTYAANTIKMQLD
jgi:hypothetical protein